MYNISSIKRVLNIKQVRAPCSPLQKVMGLLNGTKLGTYSMTQYSPHRE